MARDARRFDMKTMLVGAQVKSGLSYFRSPKKHRAEPGFESAVIAFDAVVLVLPVLWKAAARRSSTTFANAGARSVMTSPGSPCNVSAVVKDLRALGMSRRAERTRTRQSLGRAGRPPGRHRTRCRWSPARCRGRSSGLDQQRCEHLHPPVERHMIDLDAALGQEFLHVAVRQAVAEVPAHSQQDHLGRKPEPSEARGLRHDRSRTTGSRQRATLTSKARYVNATEPFNEHHGSSRPHRWIGAKVERQHWALRLRGPVAAYRRTRMTRPTCRGGPSRPCLRP